MKYVKRLNNNGELIDIYSYDGKSVRFLSGIERYKNNTLEELNWSGALVSLTIRYKEGEFYSICYQDKLEEIDEEEFKYHIL